MACSDYKNIAQVQQEFKMTYHEEHVITAQEKEPSKQFLEEFLLNQEHIDVYTSEGARAEMIICPILREVYKQYYQEYELWIQKSIRYDEKLTGTSDYMMTKRSALGKTVLEFP